MAASKAELRELMLRNVELLKRLYKSENSLEAQELIETTNDNLLNVLLNVLIRLGRGEIPLPKAKIDPSIKGQKTINLLRKRRMVTKIEQAIRGDRSDKVDILCLFTSLYSTLFYALFNRPKK